MNAHYSEVDFSRPELTLTMRYFLRIDILGLILKFWKMTTWLVIVKRVRVLSRKYRKRRNLLAAIARH